MPKHSVLFIGGPLDRHVQKEIETSYPYQALMPREYPLSDPLAPLYPACDAVTYWFHQFHIFGARGWLGAMYLPDWETVLDAVWRCDRVLELLSYDSEPHARMVHRRIDDGRRRLGLPPLPVRLLRTPPPPYWDQTPMREDRLAPSSDPGEGPNPYWGNDPQAETAERTSPGIEDPRHRCGPDGCYLTLEKQPKCAPGDCQLAGRAHP